MKKKQRTQTKSDHQAHTLRDLLHISLFGLVLIPGAFSFVYFQAPVMFPVMYEAADAMQEIQEKEKEPEIDISTLPVHIPTPKPLHAIYMSQCVVGTPSFREDLVKMAEETEINAIVIDIKDYSGKLGFTTDNPMLKDSVSDQCGAVDMKAFLRTLAEKGIYTIARITVFQDPYYTKAHPELAVRKASATTTLWADYKGLNFIDVGAKPYWDYIVEISKEAFALGFDELNYDYIRFPSDGNMKDIYYPWSEEVVDADPDYGKAVMVEKFFSYLSDNVKGYSMQSLDENGKVSTATPVTSADLFGMVTTNTDDLNIGQVLERALPHFDYVSPMTYPSHYPKWFNGWENPNYNVYGVINFSMTSAVNRALATTTPVATLSGGVSLSTSTEIYAKPVYDPNKLRPWLQDFDYGKDYRPEDIKEQIRGLNDAGLSSWYFWDPANRYESLRTYLDGLQDEAATNTSSTTVDE